MIQYLKFILFVTVSILCMTQCKPPSPNINEEGDNVLEVHQVFDKNKVLTYYDTVYIPIYSDIYTNSTSEKILLTATLSIRNTSLKDSIFINDIDYYNSKGVRIRGYLENPIYLLPLETIEYVIEKNDNEGGTGANFIINWGANQPVKPIFQGVMITTSGQHGLSFVTDGVSISKRE